MASEQEKYDRVSERMRQESEQKGRLDSEEEGLAREQKRQEL
jgi:hypothetical protein